MKHRVLVLTLLAALGAGGCQTVTDSYDRWFGSGRKPAAKVAELPPLQNAIKTQVAWQSNVGAAERSIFFPAVDGNTVYAAAANGTIAGYQANTGTQTSRFATGQKLAGGVGAGGSVIAVGTARGEVMAYDPAGKQLWAAQVAGEVLAPPEVSAGLVVVRAGDGRIYGFDAKTGTRRWLYERTTPALSLRSYAGLVVERGGIFAGFPGGRLVALQMTSGLVGWEGLVAIPRGTTELERVADVTSNPVIDREQVCASAFQGRTACFEANTGKTMWARDVSSVAGLAMDQRNLYITDDRNAVVALTRDAGASLWKQDKLFGRALTGPLSFQRYVIVGDFQGYVHFLSRDDGSFVGRIATDGSAIGAAPVALDISTFLVQTRNGGLFAIRIEQ